MQDNYDQALEADVLAAALRMDKKDAGNLLESLADKLSSSLPENTTVSRGGWFLSSSKPVEEIVVRFDAVHLQIARGKQGSFSARILKVVKGVVLKTTDVSVDEWIENLAGQLNQLAQKNKDTAAALKKFVIG